LASDEDGTLRRTLGVPRTWGIFPGRVTYVIDRQGIVRHIFEAQWTARQHVEEALRVVRTLIDEGSAQSPASHP
jgi:peroxiredoxin Q/BCP